MKLEELEMRGRGAESEKRKQDGADDEQVGGCRRILTVHQRALEPSDSRHRRKCNKRDFGGRVVDCISKQREMVGICVWVWIWLWVIFWRRERQGLDLETKG
jgi:hypothetical protein